MLKFSLIGMALIMLSGVTSAQVLQADHARFVQLVERGVAVIDIRRADEWRDLGVVEGSHLITFFDEHGNYDVNRWLAAVSKVTTPEQPVAILCHVGMRSSAVSRFLVEKVGFEKVFNVKGGIAEWIRYGGAVVPPN